MIKFQQSQALISHFERFWSIVPLFERTFDLLLSLRFYVKSNFGEFRWSKMSFLAILEVLNFDSSKFEQLSSLKFTKNSKFSL